jgi:hypothetical protein
MDQPPGANRTEWWLQVAVQPVVTPAGSRADLPRMKAPFGARRAAPQEGRPDDQTFST